MLKDLGLKQSGAKEELVERIIEANRVEIDRLISRSKIMKCSATGLAIVEQYEKEKQHDIDLARQQSYDALMRGDPKEACRIYVAYNRRYTDPDFSSSPYEVGELESILSSSPKVLGDISPSDLRKLQSATCMAKLWFDVPATDWLPDGFATRFKNNKIAVNYLARHSDLRYTVATNSENSSRFRIVFEPNDIDSCELCLALNGKEFDKRNLPELPFEGCTSETGCMCSIETIYDDDDDDLEAEIDNSDDDAGEDGQVAITKLRQLKEMLDSGLISQVEYDAKKAEILSRF